MNLTMLTGGIASGKSTVCKILENSGCKIINTDKIAHDVVQKGNIAWQQITETFGTNILKQNKQLDRIKLGDIIFSNPSERAKLNKIVHPQVFKQVAKTVNDMHEINSSQTVIVDIPLFFELARKPNPSVILVYLSQELQLIRLMQRDGCNKIDAMKRINSQIPMSKKLKFASTVINNSGSLQKTRRLTLSILANMEFRNKLTKHKFDILLDTMK